MEIDLTEIKDIETIEMSLFENNNMIDLLDKSKKIKNKIEPLYYGSICCSKKNLQDVTI